MSYFGATDTSGDVSSGFQGQSGLLICIVEANIMYVP